MKTNMLSKIAMSIANLGKSKLDFSHPVSTTMNFGDLQPTHCKLIMPKSNGVIKDKSLVRFGTMLAPTFGKIKAKEYHMLVPFSDLFKNLAPMLAQAKVASYTGGFLNPSSMPRMTLGLLSRFIMIGAKIEFFRHNNVAIGDAMDIKVPLSSANIELTKAAAETDGVWAWLKEDSDNPNVTGQTALDRGGRAFDGMHGSWLNLGKLNGNWITALVSSGNGDNMNSIKNWDFWIPVANNDINSMFGYHKVYKRNESTGNYEWKYEIHHMNLEKCDYCISFECSNGHKWTIGIMLSAFGKRLRKAIVGVGKQINMMSYAQHQMVDLFAVWKSYFDLFGLTIWTNYECTPQKSLTNYMDNGLGVNMDSIAYANIFTNWIVELGRMWYTEQQDAVGAMLTSTAVSPSLGLANSFIDVDGLGGHVTEVNSSSGIDGVGANGHAFIDAIKHGQLDAEYLMKLYHWTNKNSVVGKEIEKVLRAQNLGDYVDSLKSNFIGYHEELMQISDVVSTSDTFKDGEGSMLGQYGGRGLKVYQAGEHKFSTNEYCFQISLVTIVPEADYLQSIDPQSYVVKKTDFLLPDFDGMGLMAMRKSMVCGAVNWARQWNTTDEDSVESVMGLLPRGSHLKLAHALNNGDITLRSTIDGYLPFTMDRYINVGDYVMQKDHEDDDDANYTLLPTMQAKNLPVGGWHYRYLCKYPWIGQFTRIFANKGKQEEDDFWYGYTINAESQELGFEFCHAEYDNFIYHSLVYAPCWSPCKAIEESFETIEDGKKPNASVEHA